SEPPAILAAIARRMAAGGKGAPWAVPDPGAPLPAAQLAGAQLLAGRQALVTAGPTHEPIDPVRYIANRSSGRQGYAIAAALAAQGATVTLVSGPVNLPDPAGVTVRRVETAAQMLADCTAALPADIAVFAAAVADWRVAEAADAKLKKRPGEAPPALSLVPNPDILALLSRPGPMRPTLVVGFAAETEDVRANAEAKRLRKGCDWIVANDVRPETGIMGGAANRVLLVTAEGTQDWPELPKEEVARRLVERMAAAMPPDEGQGSALDPPGGPASWTSAGD
ncbi:MAG: phosphopantothenoylcysteine decarboxylase, partial [Janthinobacterium lividum]